MNCDALLLNINRRFSYTEGSDKAAIGLDLLAAYAARHGYEVRVHPGELSETAVAIEKLVKEENLKLVGMYCHMQNQTAVKSLSQHIKKKYGLPVIVGGPQTSGLGKDFLQTSGVSVLVQGDGEYTFVELLNYYLKGKGSLNKIGGILFLDEDEQLVKTRHWSPIQDLDSLPFPDPKRRLKKYKFDSFCIVTGRGCPFRCAYCHEGYNTNGVRYRSVENVLAEIKGYLDYINEPGVYIAILDDTFTLDANRVLEICSGLNKLRKKYDFAWFCEGHVQTILNRPEIIPAMIEAGLIRLQIGLESGSQKILDCYGKKIKLEDVRQVVDLCYRAELPMLFGNFIVGGAWETEQTFNQTKTFALDLISRAPWMMEVSCSIFKPVPNSAMTVDPDKYGITILDPDALTSVDDYPVVCTEELSRERIAEMDLDFRVTIGEKMEALTMNYPRDKILRNIQITHHYGLKNIWMECYGRGKSHARVWNVRTMWGFTGKRSNIDNNAIMDCLPIRCYYLLGKDLADLKIGDDRVLSVFESLLLLYSAGHLSVRQIIDRLRNREELRKMAADNDFADKVVTTLKEFERDYLVNLVAL